MALLVGGECFRDNLTSAMVKSFYGFRGFFWLIIYLSGNGFLLNVVLSVLGCRRLCCN